MSNFNKVLVILGPTSSGKSDTAIKLARKFNGEVISADSRQIYRGMDIGTGKVSGRLRPVIPGAQSKSKDQIFISEGIPHYMIDIVSPKTDYNVAKFKKAVDKIISEIIKRGKLPIICGGTGFWINAVVDNINFPEVKPDWKFRNKLEKKKIAELIQVLKKLDSKRLRTIDLKNPVRLIRAIEIAKTLGKIPVQNFQPIRYDFLQIGINLPKLKLYKNIEKRLNERFEKGMIKEIQNLHFKHNVSWKRLERFGLEYKWVALYLQNKMTRNEMEGKLLQEIRKYSKRQTTWWKKDKRIRWLKKYSDIEKLVNKFL